MGRSCSTFHKPVLMTFLLPFFITACSDGSLTTENNTVSTPPAGSEIISTTPKVTSTTPTNDSTSVSRSSTVTAIFSEDMLSTSIDDSSFTLTASSAVSGTVSFDGYNNIVTFTPSSNLDVLTKYTATLTTANTNLVGKSITSNYSWSFTTSEASWGSAASIDTTNTDTGAINAQIAFDADGNAFAVWQQNDGTRNNIWSNRYTTSGGWGTAALIETDDAGDANLPQIAVDTNGNAFAIWHQDDGGGTNDIWSNRYVAGTGWGDSAEIIETGTGDATIPQIAVDANGNALAVWIQSDGTRTNAMSNRYGSGWTAASATLIEVAGSGDATLPQIAIDANGDAFAVWRKHDGTRSNIWSNRYSSGWGTAALLESVDQEANYPQIAFDSSNNAIAVWTQDDGTHDSLITKRYTGGAWGTVETIESYNAGAASNPHIAFDLSGNALAVWAQNDGSVNNIASNRYVSGTGWGTPELIESYTNSASFPQISIDLNGNAFAIWQQSDGSVGNVATNRYVAETGWATATFIESSSEAAAKPQIAFDSIGRAIAIWDQSNGTQNHITSNRFQ